MSNIMPNSRVKTQFGDGVVQGPFVIRDAGNAEVARGVLVRLPINETTRPHMIAANCLTPRANYNGLWVFRESEIQPL